MGKNKKQSIPDEAHLLLPQHATKAAIVDTHTHLVSTFSQYQNRYKGGKYETIYDFVRGLYQGRNVESIVDVWCEAPVQIIWRELADSAQRKDEQWAGIEYWFVMGVHPHEAKSYTDKVEEEILKAMAHPRCVGWGEIGLDYHYDNSPRDIQRSIFIRQLRNAIKLGKPITVHTREAEEDTERILKEEVPKDHRIHIHCFTDSPELAQRLLDYFPNLYIGITGVITYSTNLNTTALIRQLSSKPPTPPNSLRILLETDAPYMIPANLYTSLTLASPDLKGKKLPLCHTAMIPWTAEFVAGVIGQEEWDTEKVMKVARENAKAVYGV